MTEVEWREESAARSVCRNGVWEDDDVTYRIGRYLPAGNVPILDLSEVPWDKLGGLRNVPTTLLEKFVDWADELVGEGK